MKNTKKLTMEKQCDIHFVISLLQKIQRFDLVNYRAGEYGIDTEREENDNGNYIDAYDIDVLIKDLTNELNKPVDLQESTEQALTIPVVIEFLKAHLEVNAGRLAEPLLKQNKLIKEDIECHKAFLMLAHLNEIEDYLN